jgi:hypothetical protein
MVGAAGNPGLRPLLSITLGLQIGGDNINSDRSEGGHDQNTPVTHECADTMLYH